MEVSRERLTYHIRRAEFFRHRILELGGLRAQEQAEKDFRQAFAAETADSEESNAAD